MESMLINRWCYWLISDVSFVFWFYWNSSVNTFCVWVFSVATATTKYHKPEVYKPPVLIIFSYVCLDLITNFRLWISYCFIYWMDFEFVFLWLFFWVWVGQTFWIWESWLLHDFAINGVIIMHSGRRCICLV